MNKIKLLIIAFLGFQTLAFGQENVEYKHFALKISPLYMLAADNTFQMGIEHRFNRKSNITISEEFGYGNGASNIYNQNSDNYSVKETFRAQIEIRKYRNDSPFLNGKYIGYELFYKQVNDQIENTLGRECDNGNCNYYERLKYPVRKFAFGGNIKVGKQTVINNRKDEKKNLLFDIFVGFGLRKIIYDHKIDLTDADLRFGRGGNNYFPFYINGYGIKDRQIFVPNVTFGLRLGFTAF
jgi:hypothetical protein